jgi:hypothetical protein
MEIHVSEALQMKTPEQLKLFASFYQNYIEKFGFRFWFLHPNPGSPKVRRVNPSLVELGLPDGICCYEIALHRPGCGS